MDHACVGYPSRATWTAFVREVFPDARTVSTGTHEPGNHSDAVKQAAVVGLYSRKESAVALAKRSEGADRRSMLGKTSSLAQRLLPHRSARKVRLWIQRSQNWNVNVTLVPRDIHELQIEHDLLETASERIKKDIGGDLQRP